MKVKFAGGKNIAMKVPPHQHEATVRFYRDLLGLEQIDGPAGNAIGFNGEIFCRPSKVNLLIT